MPGVNRKKKKKKERTQKTKDHLSSTPNQQIANQPTAAANETTSPPLRPTSKSDLNNYHLVLNGSTISEKTMRCAGWEKLRYFLEVSLMQHPDAHKSFDHNGVIIDGLHISGPHEDIDALMVILEEEMRMEHVPQEGYKTFPTNADEPSLHEVKEDTLSISNTTSITLFPFQRKPEPQPEPEPESKTNQPHLLPNPEPEPEVKEAQTPRRATLSLSSSLSSYNNPPSLILSNITNTDILHADRSSFRCLWASLCQHAFHDGTPSKFEYENIDRIDQDGDDTLTISFLERPKYKTIQQFIHRNEQCDACHVRQPQRRSFKPMSTNGQKSPHPPSRVRSSYRSSFRSTPQTSRRAARDQQTKSYHTHSPTSDHTMFSPFRTPPRAHPPAKFEIPSPFISRSSFSDERIFNVERKLDYLMDFLSKKFEVF